MSRHQNNVGDSRRYYDWVDSAYDDLLSANVLASDARCYKTAAFHCQQCIEKGLKAYILYDTGRLVDGHNLTWLCRQAMKSNSEFVTWLDESVTLNKCYIETRYPTDVELNISRSQIERILNMTSEMYSFICEQVEIIGD